MKRWNVLPLLFGVVLPLLCASPACAIDPSDVMDGLRDKGMDWLKDKARTAGEEWVFGTGQSETMQAIIDAAREASNDSNGLYQESGCRGLVQAQASTVLNDLGMKTTAKNWGRTAFNTLTKVGSLAAGGLGAAAEGGGLSWLAGQYADAAKGQASETAFDAIRKAFGKEKAPEFEVYEQSGTVGNGPCTYTLRAVWDIVNGNYYVFIAGDCKCQTIASGQAQSRAVGKWWMSFEGSMLMSVDKDAGTVKFTPKTPPKVDFDAQCGCGTRPLKRPFTSRKIQTTTATTGTTTTGATDNGGTGVTPGGNSGNTPGPPPPPIPPKGRQVCKECQGIQNRIDADSDAFDAANSNLNDATNDLKDAQARLDRDQGLLDAVKANPKDYDISVSKVQSRIDADNADIATAKAKGAKAGAEAARLENELRGLGVQLDNCIRNCGHASVPKKVKHSLFDIGIDKALDKHRKKDDKDDDEHDDDDH